MRNFITTYEDTIINLIDVQNAKLSIPSKTFYDIFNILDENKNEKYYVFKMENLLVQYANQNNISLNVVITDMSTNTVVDLKMDNLYMLKEESVSFKKGDITFNVNKDYVFIFDLDSLVMVTTIHDLMLYIDFIYDNKLRNSFKDYTGDDVIIKHDYNEISELLSSGKAYGFDKAKLVRLPDKIANWHTYIYLNEVSFIKFYTKTHAMRFIWKLYRISLYLSLN